MLTLIGLISFSVYLVHFMFIGWLSIYAARIEQVLAPDLAFVVLSLLVLAVSVLLSLATYRWVELPMIRVGHSLAARRRPLLQASRA